MQLHTSRVITILTLTALAGLTIAGPLTPGPGPVASTMKSLAEVEPRTPISQATTPGNVIAQFRITQSGAYYLTGNLVIPAGKTGILIEAPFVTIDLNGFRISAASGGGEPRGIVTPQDDTDVRGAIVRNGSVTGFAGGCVSLESGSRIENVIAHGAGANSVLSVSGDSRIVNCTASGGFNGIAASYASIIQDCTAYDNANAGFAVVGATVRNCTARGNGDSGIFAQVGAVIENNHLMFNDETSGKGIFISGNGSRIEGNSITGSRVGILLLANATDNVVARNRVRTGVSTAYAMDGQTPGNFPNNHVAQIIANPASPFAATNPFANIEH